MDGKKRKFIICHADGGRFTGEGLRAFCECRRPGMSDAARGRFGASVIRAAPGMSSWGGWHSHDLDFQMVHAAGCWFCSNMRVRARIFSRRVPTCCSHLALAIGSFVTAATPRNWLRLPARRNLPPKAGECRNENLARNFHKRRSTRRYAKLRIGGQICIHPFAFRFYHSIPKIGERP